MPGFSFVPQSHPADSWASDTLFHWPILSFPCNEKKPQSIELHYLHHKCICKCMPTWKEDATVLHHSMKLCHLRGSWTWIWCLRGWVPAPVLKPFCHHVIWCAKPVLSPIICHVLFHDIKRHLKVSWSLWIIPEAFQPTVFFFLYKCNLILKH